MPTSVLLGHRKYSYYQSNVTDEANTDAGTTWTAAEVTLVTSLRTKVNAILAALTSAGIIAGTIPKTGKVWGTKPAWLAQADITDVATGTIDVTYALSAEGDVINSLKTKVNAIIAAMNKAGFGGAKRYVYYGYARPRQKVNYSLALTPITIADADGTYTSGASGEQGLINDIKTKVNTVLAALRAAKVITT